MGIFGSIQGPIRAVLNNLINDRDLREQVKYDKYTGQAFDSELGHEVNTYASTVPYCIRLQHNADSVKEATFEVQIGDNLFMFRGTDVPEGASLKDQIVDEAGLIYKVKDIQNIFGLAVSVTVEGG